MVSSHMQEDGSASGFSVCSYGIKGKLPEYRRVERKLDYIHGYSHYPDSEANPRLCNSSVMAVFLTEDRS